MRYTRLSEIDALKDNLPFLTSQTEETTKGKIAKELHAAIDKLIESENIRVSQIPLIGEIAEKAYLLGQEDR